MRSTAAEPGEAAPAECREEARISEPAPAKVNLALHVTGRRDDGYHLLDSLVVFTRIGDVLHLERLAKGQRGGGAADPGFADFGAAGVPTLNVTGPMAAGVPAGRDNLVLRAAALAGAADVAITLEKHLPLAAGIGGGSADAAAVLRGFARLGTAALPTPAELAGLGADVPVCMSAQPQRMRGIGERLEALALLPPLWLVLVNPGVGVPTGAAFAGLDGRYGAPMPEALPRFADAADLAAFLQAQRNDLEAPARRIAPQVDAVLTALVAQSDCLLARMSGSGATCFGIFAEERAAVRAAETIGRSEAGWWVAATEVLNGT